MKCYLIIPLLCFTLLVSAQSIKPLNSDSLLAHASNQFEEANYEEAYKLLKQVNENDSIYSNALVLMSRVYLRLEKYDEAINLCDSFIQANTNGRQLFYTNKGVAEIRKGEYLAAIQTYQEALKFYPLNYLINYNLGVCFEEQQHYEEAVRYYQKSILLNPFYAPPHLQLANLCYKNDLVTQASLCWNFYLFLEPNASNALNVLVALNNAVSQKNENELINIKVSEDDNSFEEIDLLVKNYAALDKKYKIENPINVPAIKQSHAIFNMLKDYEGNNGFWTERYAPFFRKIMDAGYFDQFTYRIMSSTTNEKYIKIIQKKAKPNDNWLSELSAYWQQLCGSNSAKLVSDFDGNLEYSNNWVNAVELYGESKELTGENIFFNSNGSLLSKGFFINGNREKDWTWYNEKGEITAKAHYSDGVLSGDSFNKYDNGNIETEASYKNDYYNGIYKEYNLFGALTEASTFNEGTLDGPAKLYYDLGDGFLNYDLTYKNGEYDSVATQYYPSGAVKMKLCFKNGTKINDEIHFFEDGSLSYEYHYKNGELDSTFISMHLNGKLHQKGQYLQGEKYGIWQTFLDNGVISVEENYDEKGRLNGDCKYYNKDGKIYYIHTYDKNKLIAFKYFDANGTVLTDQKKKNQQFNYTAYYSNGNKMAEGVYSVQGDKEGTWQYYDCYGALSSVELYKDGEINGQDLEYYSNGALKAKDNYKNGQINGYSAYYYIDGTIKKEAYYQNGKPEGIVKAYYPDGTLSEKSYYHNGIQEGVQYDYGIEGKVASKSYLSNDKMLKIEYFDSVGNLLYSTNYCHDTLINYKYSNGVSRIKQQLKHGYLHGYAISKYFNGQIATEGNYFFGNLDGIWKYYNEEGQLTNLFNFNKGNYHGVSKVFHENGQLSSSDSFYLNNRVGWNYLFNEKGDTTYKAFYINGEKNGPAFYYSKKGELQLVRFYHYDELVGYSYPTGKGVCAATIPINKGSGIIDAYFSNGQPSRHIEFQNGQINNKYLNYCSNGKLYENTLYKCGENYGESLEYYETGQLKRKCDYLNDALHGEYIVYHPNGKVKEKSFYVNGGLSGEKKEYDEAGNWIKTISYYNNEVTNVIIPD